MLIQRPLTSSIVKATASKVFSSVPCALTWRDRKLFVRAASLEESLDLEALQDSDRLVECLKRSPVELVKLDSDLSPELLLHWAEACGQAKKACYVSQFPSTESEVTKDRVKAWIQRVLHRTTAVLIMTVLAPIFAFLALSFNLAVKKQWAVLSGGKLSSIWLPIDGEQSSRLDGLVTRLINAVQGNMLLSDSLPLILKPNS